MKTLEETVDKPLELTMRLRNNLLKARRYDLDRTLEEIAGDFELTRARIVIEQKALRKLREAGRIINRMPAVPLGGR